MKEDATTFWIKPDAVKVGTQPDAWKVHHYRSKTLLFGILQFHSPLVCLQFTA